MLQSNGDGRDVVVVIGSREFDASDGRRMSADALMSLGSRSDGSHHRRRQARRVLLLLCVKLLRLSSNGENLRGFDGSRRRRGVGEDDVDRR